MVNVLANLIRYRELIGVLAWKNIAMRYKQAFLGIAWAVLKPVMLMTIFTVIRGFIGIDSGGIPYPVLTFAALMPWTLFQDSTSDGVNSVVGNAHLIRKIYFPREIFPVTAVVTKTVEFLINCLVLAGLMAWYGIAPTWQILWVPLLLLYVLLASLSIAFVGAAMNVYFRDVSAALPVVLSLIMYLSPVIYPIHLVQEKLLRHGEEGSVLYTIYLMNPLAGIIDAFQRVVLKGLSPDPATLMPGFILVVLLLPVSYLIFKRAEAYFADVI